MVGPSLRTFLLASLAAPFLVLGAVLVLLAGWLVYLKLLALSDPLKDLPGSSEGTFQQIDDDLEEWAREHANAPCNGKTPRNLRLPGLFPFEGRLRLLTTDRRVISHILASPNFEKPKESRAFLSKLLGKGIFMSEGAEHKAMRKAYAPAFSRSVLRHLEPMMMQKADQLCEIWAGQLKKGPIDVHSALNRAALDITAALAFGEDINAVADTENLVYTSYRRMLQPVEYGKNAFRLYLSLQMPWLDRLFPDEVALTFQAAHSTILKIGRSLLHLDAAGKCGTATKDEELTAPSLLSAILRDSTPSGILSEAELLGALSTFLFSGADASGTTLAFALNNLAQDVQYQRRLRAELAAIPHDAERPRALESSPLLNNFIRETLRVSPPLPATIRVAVRDEVLCASEDIILNDGSVTRQFMVKKGCFIHIPIEPLNTFTDDWGADAKKFNPDRWFDLPATAKGLPGIHDTMSFTCGPHACPGYNIALTEMRLIISAVIERFELHPSATVGRQNAFMFRPYVKGKWLKEGVQLPLVLKPVTL